MRTDEYHATDLLETGGSLEAVIKLIDDNARANTECMLACADSGGGESGDASLQSEKALEELSDEELLVLGKHAELLIRHELVMHPGWRLLAAYAHLEFSRAQQMEACLQVMAARVEKLKRELDARQSVHK